jgi:beta-xylosidase
MQRNDLMKLKYTILTSILFIFGCGSPTQTAAPQAANPFPTEEVAQPATESFPTETQAIVDPNYFRDDFENNLGPGWQWLREVPSNWSLTAVPGALQINVDGGEVSDETMTNLLLRAPPAGNFQMETKITFSPKADFQFAGLIIYESASNLIQAGRAFCDLPDVCVGDGLYVDYYNNGSFVTPNFAAAYPDSEVYLRLIRQGETYTFQSSADGSEWILRGGTVSSMNPLQIGLAAGQNTTSIIPALFDYFEVRSLP